MLIIIGVVGLVLMYKLGVFADKKYREAAGKLDGFFSLIGAYLMILVVIFGSIGFFITMIIGFVMLFVS